MDHIREEWRTVLRTEIQMGGERSITCEEAEDYLSAVAFLLSDEDTYKCIALIFRGMSPAQRIAELRRRLIMKGTDDGYHGEDRR